MCVSYARRADPGSDIYLYMHVDGYLECNSCSLAAPPQHSFRGHNTGEMISHLGEHLSAGHRVPGHVIPELLADDDDNFPTDRTTRGREAGMTSEHDALVSALATAGVVPPGSSIRRIVVEVDDGHGGLAPGSIESVAATGPQVWGFSVTIDWSGAETPTPRTSIPDLTADQATVTTTTIADDGLSVLYAGQITAEDRQSASDTLMAAAEVVAEGATPSVPGWGTSCSVWQ
jgi:hypothetical protein